MGIRRSSANTNPYFCEPREARISLLSPINNVTFEYDSAPHRFLADFNSYTAAEYVAQNPSLSRDNLASFR